MESIAITGGSGFIGAYLIGALLAARADIVIYVLDIVPPQIESDRVRFIHADVTRADDLPRDLLPDLCFHLAAVCREPGYEWEEYFKANYAGTRNICAWAEAVGVRQIVFTSTAMVFRASERRQVETDTPNADTGYGMSKALAEEALRGWVAGAQGRSLQIVRPGVVFGKNGGGNFVNLHRALARRMFFYIGRPNTVKSCIYIKDLVRLLLVCAEHDAPYAIYHGAYPRPTTIGMICAGVCRAMGWSRHIPTIPFKLARFVALGFEILNAIGLKNPIHHRRIEKLYYSIHIGADSLADIGFEAEYDLHSAIRDWVRECAPDDPY